MSRRPDPSESGAPSPGVRLQRVMAEAGVASRRECEAMIERGLVEVNGQTVTRLPVFIDPQTDRVVVDGRPLRLRRPTGPKTRRSGARDAAAAAAGRVYIMLHKPDRVLCTTRDDAEEGAGRTTVVDLVKHSVRIYPVGRLDYHSTGLVLLTNDGELADRLTHARYGVTRTYRVTVKGSIRPDMLDDLRRRVGKADPDDARGHGGVRVAREAGVPGRGDKPATANSVLEVTLREGKSRRLQAILEEMGIVVRKLTRVGIGPLRLSGIGVGEWRDLTRDEVRSLKQAGPTSDSTASRAGGAAAGAVPRRRPPRRSEPTS